MNFIDYVDASKEQWEEFTQILADGNPILHNLHSKVREIGAKELKKPQFGIFDLYLHILPLCQKGESLEIWDASLTPPEVEAILNVRDAFPKAITYLNKLCYQQALRLYTTVRGKAEEQDLVEEAYIAIHRAMVSYNVKQKDNASFFTYVYRVVTNQLNRHVNYLKRFPAEMPFIQDVNGRETLLCDLVADDSFAESVDVFDIEILESVMGCKIAEFMEDPISAKNLSMTDARIIHGQMQGTSVKCIAEGIGYTPAFVKKRTKLLNSWFQNKLAA